MPEPRSISELPSTSTTTPPPAAAAYTGMVTPTPVATAADLRAWSSAVRGPGRAVTSRRSWGRVGPPVRISGTTVMDAAPSGSSLDAEGMPARHCQIGQSDCHFGTLRAARLRAVTTRLATLLADRPLGLRLLAGRDDTEVGWAHSSDLAGPDALPRGRQPAAHHRHPVRRRRTGERVRRLRGAGSSRSGWPPSASAPRWSGSPPSRWSPPARRRTCRCWRCRTGRPSSPWPAGSPTPGPSRTMPATCGPWTPSGPCPWPPSPPSGSPACWRS